MSKQRLFPKALADNKREPQEQFNDIARRIFSVPKSEIDEREKQWQEQRRTKPRKRS
jgi:hypothetical protein